MSGFVGKLQNHSAVKELNENKRLQWLLFGVLVILMLSLGKRAVDSLNEPGAELVASLNLMSRLEHSAQQPFDDQQLTEAEQLAAQRIATFNQAVSASTAEAQALAITEMTFRPLIARSRISLLGSQELDLSGQTFYQVRLEINGQLEERRFIELLKLVDRNIPGARLSSMQYAPKAANTFNAVVDMLFVRSADE